MADHSLHNSTVENEEEEASPDCPSFLFGELFYFYFMGMGVWTVCMALNNVHVVPTEVRRGRQISWI